MKLPVALALATLCLLLGYGAGYWHASQPYHRYSLSAFNSDGIATRLDRQTGQVRVYFSDGDWWEQKPQPTDPATLSPGHGSH